MSLVCEVSVADFVPAGDVCTRVIGVLEHLVDPLSVHAFTFEVVCDHCLKTYRPCSDCGGGGGRLSYVLSGKCRVPKPTSADALIPEVTVAGGALSCSLKAEKTARSVMRVFRP